MALWDDYGFNSARYINICQAAEKGESLEEMEKRFGEPLDADEKRLFNQCVDILAKAKAEGRTVVFDAPPFDLTDRYDDIYRTTPQEMYDNIKDRL